MRVVSNTSPISNLAIIDRLSLLKIRYEYVSIPPAVAKELSMLAHSDARNRIERAVREEWLFVDSNPVPDLSATCKLDPGEEAAIAMALHLKADLLLMDEKLGRAAARKMGIQVSGILGELLNAKIVGRIPNLAIEIQRLRNEAGFFMDSSIERFILHEAGE